MENKWGMQVIFLLFYHLDLDFIDLGFTYICIDQSVIFIKTN